MPEIVVVCSNPDCGTLFSILPSRFAKSKTKRFFCSNDCLHLIGAKPRTIPDLTCEQCKKTVRRVQLERFCSKECYDMYARRNKVQKTCGQCGGVFDKSASVAAVVRFCSKRCELNSKIKRGTGTYRNGVESVLNDQGYVWAWEPDHPKASHGRYAEHRLVVEDSLGRYLLTEEQVHHINGVKTDNRLDNLKLLSPSVHTHVTLSESGQKRRAAQDRIQELEAELAKLRSYN